MAGNVRSVRARPQRLEVSPYDSSLRVRDAANGRGNSQGFGVSYYDTGWLVGMILDLAILDETNGRRSLDTVEKGLARDLVGTGKVALYGRKAPGFTDESLAQRVAAAGGPAVAALYERIVMKPGELPVEEALARAGLELRPSTRKALSLPITIRPDVEAGYPKITEVTKDKAVANFSVGSHVTAINDIPLAGATNRAQSELLARALATDDDGALKDRKYAGFLKVSIKTPDGEAFTLVIPATDTREVPGYEVTEMPNATRRQLQVRALWMAKRRPGS